MYVCVCARAKWQALTKALKAKEALLDAIKVSSTMTEREQGPQIPPSFCKAGEVFWKTGKALCVRRVAPADSMIHDMRPYDGSMRVEET